MSFDETNLAEFEAIFGYRPNPECVKNLQSSVIPAPHTDDYAMGIFNMVKHLKEIDSDDTDDESDSEDSESTENEDESDSEDVIFLDDKKNQISHATLKINGVEFTIGNNPPMTNKGQFTIGQ